MYRDFIEAPEKIEHGETVWWIQVLHRRDETVDVVNLYDEEGWFVKEFKSREEALDYIGGQK